MQASLYVLDTNFTEGLLKLHEWNLAIHIINRRGQMNSYFLTVTQQPDISTAASEHYFSILRLTVVREREHLVGQ